MIFKDLIRKTFEACIDDMVVKSLDQAIQHLQDVLDNMRLNPAKCLFGLG